MKIQTFYDLFNLFMGIMYMSHLTACIMYYISNIEYKKGNPTMFAAELALNKDWVFMYLNCLYFSVVTIVTVGYGDFSPKES